MAYYSGVMNRYNLVSFAGLFVLMAIAWAFSSNRRKVNWRVVIWGTLLQLLLAVIIFWAPGVDRWFNLLNDGFLKLLSAAQAGQKFVFGSLGDGTGDAQKLGFILAFQAFPTIIFFSALMGLLYFWRVMPMLIRAFAAVFSRFMRVSGAESLCTATNIFMGIESFTCVRPYLATMTRSEFCTILTAGMATVASSTMGLYVLFLKDVFPGIAGHLMMASVLSAPAALIMSKLLLPENDRPDTLGINPKIPPPGDAGSLDAIINGAMAGLQMVLGVTALLIAFLGLLALANMLVGAGGRLFGAELSLGGLLGYLFYPLALVTGIPPADATFAGNLLGLRLVATEVPAYQQLAAAIANHSFSNPRSPLIIAYCLCGFAHVASLAIFTGGAVALVPERRADIVSVGLRALVAATLACLMTGAVAGVFFHG
jgi:CNT family concentrative nucleoside transporter